MGEEDVSWVSTWKPQNLNICPFFPSKLKKNSEGESISTILNSRPLNDLLIHVESILLHNFHLTLVPPMPRRTKICFVRPKTRPEKYKRLLKCRAALKQEENCHAWSQRPSAGPSLLPPRETQEGRFQRSSCSEAPSHPVPSSSQPHLQCRRVSRTNTDASQRHQFKQTCSFPGISLY